MNKCKKIIALLLAVLFVLPLGVLGVFAEDATATGEPVNLITAENTKITANRTVTANPVARLVDGVKAYKSSFNTYAATTSYGSTDNTLTYYQFEFTEAITINEIKTFLSNQELNNRNRDYAVDVQLENGAWIRVAEEHNTAAKYAALAEKLNNPQLQDYENDGTYMYRRYTFPTVTVKGFRISANSKRVTDAGVTRKGFHMLEVEAYLNENVTSYTGVESPDNADYAIANSNFAHATYTDQWYDYAYVMGTASSNSPHPSYQITSTNDEAYPDEKKTVAVAQYDSTTNTAWYQIDFSTAITVNGAKIFAPDQVDNVPADYAVDVKTTDGLWTRVVEDHGLSTDKYRNFYFAPQIGVAAIRVTANRNGNSASNNFMLRSLHIGFLPEKTASDYTGITKPTDSTLAIPEPKSDNLAVLAKASSSNTDANYVSSNPVTLINDTKGIAGSAQAVSDAIINFALNNNTVGYYQLDFASPIPVSNVILYRSQYDMEKFPHDLSVDVKTSDGIWHRVAEMHDVPANDDWADHTRNFKFAAVDNVVSVRLSGNKARGGFNIFRAAEIAVYYDPTIAEVDYTGTEKATDTAYDIPYYLSDNFALNGVVSTNSELAKYPVQNIVDGSQSINTAGIAQYDNNKAWVQVNFAKAKTVNQVVIYHCFEAAKISKDVAVEVKLTNGSWVRVAEAHEMAVGASNTSKFTREFNFAPISNVVAVRYTGLKTGTGGNFAVTELEAYYNPSITADDYTGVTAAKDWKNDILAVDHIVADINGSGAVDGDDLIASKKILLGVKDEALAADVNADFVINVLDFIATSKAIVTE